MSKLRQIMCYLHFHEEVLTIIPCTVFGLVPIKREGRGVAYDPNVSVHCKHCDWRAV